MKTLQGAINSYNPRAYQHHSRWRSQEAKMLIMVQNNKMMYKNIISAVSYKSIKIPLNTLCLIDLTIQL